MRGGRGASSGEPWTFVERRQAKGYGFLVAKPAIRDMPDDVIVAAFRKRLREGAGFGYVPDPIPMRNSKKAIVYYLFLASPKAVAEKIITAIFNKYR